MLNAERSKPGTRTYSGHVLVHRALDSSVERHMSVVYHNADRVHRVACVAAKYRVAINCASGTHSDRIVEHRNRQHLHLAYNVLDPGRMRHDGESRVLRYVV